MVRLGAVVSEFDDGLIDLLLQRELHVARVAGLCSDVLDDYAAGRLPVRLSPERLDEILQELLEVLKG